MRRAISLGSAFERAYQQLLALLIPDVCGATNNMAFVDPRLSDTCIAVAALDAGVDFVGEAFYPQVLALVPIDGVIGA